jgi:phosphopantothenoylcysteine decarboxylase/phosphopantothenate--cysteine ligase
LVLANVSATETFQVVRADTAAEMLVALSARASANDALIMTAAISDFRVVQPSLVKLKRGLAGDTFELTLIQNEDILARLAPEVHEANPNALVIGFAAETESDDQLLELAARKKLISKGCDLIVANDVSDRQVFDKDSNSVRIVSSEAPTVSVSGSKGAVADAILDAMLMRWHNQ